MRGVAERQMTVRRNCSPWQLMSSAVIVAKAAMTKGTHSPFLALSSQDKLSFRSHGKECNGCQERGGEDASSVEKREIGEMSSKISFEGEQQRQEEGRQRAEEDNPQVEADVREEVDAEDADSEVEELSTVVFEPGMLVLVQNNKYQWPGRVVDVGANSLFRVQLFDKPGLYDGKLRSFDSAAVKVFQYSNELKNIVQTSNNNELKQAFRKALRIIHGLE